MRFKLLPFLALAILSPKSMALDLDPNEIRGTGGSKQPVSVLQQRFFTKSFRPEIGVLAGTFLNEAYTDTAAFGVRGAFFASEWLGLELQYLKTNVKDSDDRQALNTIRYRSTDENDNTVKTLDPEVDAIHQVVDANVIAAPFYGKLNFLDKMIVYADLYLASGISRVQTDQGTLNALSLGGGQRFYFMNNMAFRLEFRDRTYVEQRAGQQTRRHALSVDFGASYFL